MASADAMARSSNTVGAKAAAAEKAALQAAAQRKIAATPVKRYGSADALARNPSVVGQKAAAAERAAVQAAQPPKGPYYGSADAMAMSSNIVGPEAAAAEAAARRAGEERSAAYYAAQNAAPAPVTTRTTGSGRTGNNGSGGGGGGEVSAPVSAAPMFLTPDAVTAPPAVTQPPAIVADAPASEVNVPGESFTSVGTPGTFGQLERLRNSRGPRTGLSVTPEMIRRAAATRLG